MYEVIVPEVSQPLHEVTYLYIRGLSVHEVACLCIRGCRVCVDEVPLRIFVSLGSARFGIA